MTKMEKIYIKIKIKLLHILKCHLGFTIFYLEREMTGIIRFLICCMKT